MNQSGDKRLATRLLCVNLPEACNEAVFTASLTSQQLLSHKLKSGIIACSLVEADAGVGDDGVIGYIYLDMLLVFASRSAPEQTQPSSKPGKKRHQTNPIVESALVRYSWPYGPCSPKRCTLIRNPRVGQSLDDS